jgi:hypothetical protein
LTVEVIDREPCPVPMFLPGLVYPYRCTLDAGHAEPHVCYYPEAAARPSAWDFEIVAPVACCPS